MKALFLIPPCEFNARGLPIDRVYGCNYGFDYKPAIHFLGVATYARDVLGWEVRFLDCPAEDMDGAGFSAHIAEEQCDVVLLWSTYLSAVEDLTAARLVAAAQSAAKIVFMGTASTWRPEEFDVSGRAWLLLGEPEHTLRDLDAIWRGEQEAEGTPGLGYWSDGTFMRGGFRELLDVTSLPMPDRTLLRGEYRANRLDVGPITVMAVSRGCGFRCTFCTTNAIDQSIDLEFKRLQPVFTERPPLRKRSTEQIIEEFRAIAAQGYKSVEIADNIFTWGKKRTMQICAGIEDLGLHWICLARANMLHDPEQIQAMARAGCKMVYMGSESFDDGLLDDMVKEIKVRDIHKAVQTCRENGIEPEVSVLIGGSPNETWRTLFNSWRAARRLGTKFVHFSVALPSPSTEMYDQAMENGWFIEGDFRPADNAREVIIDLPNLSHRELQLALKLAYAAQYLSPTGVWKHARTVRNLDDFRHKVQSAGRLLGFLMEQDEDRALQLVPPGRVTPYPT
ncbi:MAG: anaerobic magnesium-protoporphyrin IX monomethyl ester cyclase [Myxococcota bacterium]|jgi:anaerobic magnesium-protoporphyrin IX monomethyl ester cyclase